jgi:hypothetical protein
VDERLVNDATFLSVALLFFMLILAIHQDQKRDGVNPRIRWLALGVVSNVIGVGLLVWFILAVKGV